VNGLVTVTNAVQVFVSQCSEAMRRNESSDQEVMV
jgi:hypothetical protein